jgi:hypothetical protein
MENIFFCEKLKTHYYYSVLQHCLTLPSSHQILSSFGLNELLAIRCSTRIATTGIIFQNGKTKEERIIEKDEREQLANFHDLLVVPPTKLKNALAQIRIFQQQLFEGKDH